MDQDEFEQRLREDSARMFSSEDAGRRYFICKPPQFPKIESFSDFEAAHDAIVEAAVAKMSALVADAALTNRDKCLGSYIEAINLGTHLNALKAAGDSRWQILDPRVENVKRGAAIGLQVLKERGGCNA
ncbi:hypothetical protein [Thioalkalivibrio sp. ALJ1]|uniref:hypothetical protein n=1 Tax=Thioalkalivibrio sp. ALJ1 TaxID=1158144 RepID=UPI000571DA07|nr:hypothetical protein [Thioalkalivibrio sp. ALJ1]